MGAHLNKKDIIEKTLRDMHSSADPAAPDYDEEVVAYLQERVPEGDSKTCEDYKYLNVECCEICHTFMAHTEMDLVALPEEGNAWICHTVHSALFPKPKVDEKDSILELFYWTISGHDVKDYCGDVSDELFEEMVKAGVLLDEELREEGQEDDADEET